MQTTIKLNYSELNNALMDKIRDFVKGRNTAEITITITDEEDYLDVLRRSISDSEQNKDLISFSMEEFMAYNESNSPVLCPHRPEPRAR